MRWGSRAALGLAFITLFVPTVAAISFFPEAKSQIQRDWEELFMLVFWAALIVFVVVEGLLLYAMVRFRKRKGGPQEGPHIHGNTKMEIAWTIAPTLVMAWLLVVSLDYLERVDGQPEADYTIDVWAQQFSWKFYYPPEYDDTNATSGRVFLQAGTSFKFRVQSVDVIHALNIPQLGVMIDAVPGRINYFSVTPEEPGTYLVQCRELCGVGHGRMVAELVVFAPGTQPLPYGAPPVPPSNDTAPPADQTVPEGDARFTIDLTDFGIAPTLVEAQPGQTVVLDVRNRAGATTHNVFVGTTYDESQPDNGALWKTSYEIAGGASEFLVIELPMEAGYYEIWCDIPGHRDLGMKADFSTGGQKAGEKVPLLPGPSPLAILALLGGVGIWVARRRRDPGA